MNLLQSLEYDKLSVIALYKLVLELALALELSRSEERRVGKEC